MIYSMRVALATAILALSGASIAAAQIKGMPGLDATQPIGKAAAPRPPTAPAS